MCPSHKLAPSASAVRRGGEKNKNLPLFRNCAWVVSYLLIVNSCSLKKNFECPSTLSILYLPLCFMIKHCKGLTVHLNRYEKMRKKKCIYNYFDTLMLRGVHICKILEHRQSVLERNIFVTIHSEKIVTCWKYNIKYKFSIK